MVKIAFGSKMRVGKDAAVNHLCEEHGGIHLSFASPLYDVLDDTQAYFNLPRCKDREFLRMIGDWARRKNPDVFVDLLLDELTNNHPNIFVSDVRYMNEFEALKKEGFYMVKIVRPCESERPEEHLSETSLDVLPEEEWNAVVVNDGSLQEYHCKLDSLWENILLQTTCSRVCPRAPRKLPRPRDPLETHSLL